jgi:anti-anti-sigma factor
MTIKERMTDEVTILDLEGTIAHGEEGRAFVRHVGEILDAGRKQILLNMEGVLYVDSMGLGELLKLKKSALVRGADIRLVRPRPRVYGVLVETSLTKIFECFEDEQAAVGSFRKQA